MSGSRALARAVVIHHGLVLLIRRSDDDEIAPGIWQCPGGMVEEGETAREAVLRELHEETGLTAARVVALATVSRAVAGHDERWLQHEFLVSVGSGEVRLSEEHQDWRWVDPDALDSIDGLSEFARRAIERARRRSGSGGAHHAS